MKTMCLSQKMKLFVFACFSVIILVGCGDDKEEIIVPPVAQGGEGSGGDSGTSGTENNPDENTGKNNTTDKAVTGGVKDATHTSVTILGYVNIDESQVVSAQAGVEYSQTEDFDSPTKLYASELVNGRSFMVTATNLAVGGKYYYRTFLKLGTATYSVYYGTTLSFNTKNICPNSNHPHYIDLGIGVKWACCNVGAKTPNEFGGYYAWGETSTKTNYEWSNYKWCNGTYYTLTKYCSEDEGYDNYESYGIVDNKTELELDDDAARANWGGTWRMPTYEEQRKIIDQCTWTEIVWNNLNGCLVTGSNGNSIFFPAAGYRSEGRLEGVGTSNSYYWSSTRAWTPDGAVAFSLQRQFPFGIPTMAYRYGSSRCYGYSVRPVSE